MSSLNAHVSLALTTTDVEQLLAMRETRNSLKDRIALMDEAVDALEDKILSALDSGNDLSHISYVIKVHTTERRYPAWKEHFISRLGKLEADVVLEATVPVTHRKVVIK